MPDGSTKPMTDDHDASTSLARARVAQASWKLTPIAERIRVIACFGRLLFENARSFSDVLAAQSRVELGEAYGAQVLPLIDACRFLKSRSRQILATRRSPRMGKPFWLLGTRSEVRREPYGVILIIGASNYPLLLVGTQILQALIAGNSVIVKPGRGSTNVIDLVLAYLKQSGLPNDLLQVTDDQPETAQSLIRQGVDKVVLTGSLKTGQAVLKQLAETITPSVMELSGSDPVFVLPGADLQRASQGIAFALRLNRGATCIGPRKVFVTATDYDEFKQLLKDRLSELDALLPIDGLHPQFTEIESSVREQVASAVSGGASILYQMNNKSNGHCGVTVLINTPSEHPLANTDIFAPVLSVFGVDSVEDALRSSASSNYRLGATIFGNVREAKALAARIDVGSVAINDIIAPTADPGLPFGGCRSSGFGVTRGVEGLLEMTRCKSLSVNRSRWLPHLNSPKPDDFELFLGLTKLMYGPGISTRWSGLKEVIRHSGSKRKNRNE